MTPRVLRTRLLDIGHVEPTVVYKTNGVRCATIDGPLIEVVHYLNIHSILNILVDAAEPSAIDFLRGYGFHVTPTRGLPRVISGDFNL